MTEADGRTADFLNVNRGFAEGFTIEQFREYTLENLRRCDEHNNRMAAKPAAVPTVSKGFKIGDAADRSQEPPSPHPP